MLALLALSGVGLVALPALARPLGRRLAPAEWSRLCAAALAAGAVTAEGTLLLGAGPTVLRAVGLGSVAVACERMLGPLVPPGSPVGWGFAAAALAVPVRAGLGVWRALRGRAVGLLESRVGHRRHHVGLEVVVLPTEQPFAVSVPGPRAQIVVSDGLVASLSPGQLSAVLDHEAAHLTHRHHRYLLLAAAVDQALGVLPLVRWSAATLRTALERWADEAATGTPAARNNLRDAIVRVVAVLVDAPALAAFGAADTVIERLDALDAPPRPPGRLVRAVLYAPGTVLGLAVAVGVAACTVPAPNALAAVCGCI